MSILRIRQCVNDRISGTIGYLFNSPTVTCFPAASFSVYPHVAAASFGRQHHIPAAMVVGIIPHRRFCCTVNIVGSSVANDRICSTPSGSWWEKKEGLGASFTPGLHPGLRAYVTTNVVTYASTPSGSEDGIAEQWRRLLKLEARSTLKTRARTRQIPDESGLRSMTKKWDETRALPLQDGRTHRSAPTLPHEYFQECI
jgi:hypothetical protein